MLLNVVDDNDDDEVAGAQQSGVLKDRAAAADGNVHTIQKKRGFSADDVSFGTRVMEITSLFVTEVPFILNYNCTVAPLPKPSK